MVVMLQEGFLIGKKSNLLALYVDTLDWLLHRLCGGALSIFPYQITPKLIESSNGGIIGWDAETCASMKGFSKHL